MVVGGGLGKASMKGVACWLCWWFAELRAVVVAAIVVCCVVVATSAAVGATCVVSVYDAPRTYHDLVFFMGLIHARGCSA